MASLIVSSTSQIASDWVEIVVLSRLTGAVPFYAATFFMGRLLFPDSNGADAPTMRSKQLWFICWSQIEVGNSQAESFFTRSVDAMKKSQTVAPWATVGPKSFIL